MYLERTYVRFFSPQGNITCAQSHVCTRGGLQVRRSICIVDTLGCDTRIYFSYAASQNNRLGCTSRLCNVEMEH